MMIRMAVVVLVAVSASALAFAAPGDVSLAKPAVVCPQTQLGDEALQSRYDELWKAYGEKVASATKATEDELARLYEAAKSAGNLDLALFWNAMKKSFAETGKLRWEPANQKKDWKRFGNAEFPEGLTGILSKCDAGFDKAKDALEEGYKTLEVALTKADKLEQALSIRKEFGALWGAAPSPPPDPPKPEVVDLLKQIKLDELQGWKRTGGILGSGVLGKERVSPLSVPVTVRGDYDLAAEVNLRTTAVDNTAKALGIRIVLPRLEGSPGIHVGTTTTGGGRCMYFALAATGERPQPASIAFDPGFTNNTWHEVVVRVRKSKGEVTVVIDGKETLKAAPFLGLAESETVTLGPDTSNNQLMVRQWELRKIP